MSERRGEIPYYNADPNEYGNTAKPAKQLSRLLALTRAGYRRPRRAGLSYFPGEPAQSRSRRASRILGRIKSEVTPEIRSMPRIIAGHHITAIIGPIFATCSVIVSVFWSVSHAGFLRLRRLTRFAPASLRALLGSAISAWRAARNTGSGGRGLSVESAIPQLYYRCFCQVSGFKASCGQAVGGVTYLAKTR